MSRLYDRILGSKGIPDTTKIAISTADLIVGDNVAHYLFNGTDQEYWDKNDFPNTTPPSKSFFTDFCAPKTIVSEDFGIIEWGSDRPHTWGIHNLVFDTQNENPDTFKGWSEYFTGRKDLEMILNEATAKIQWVIESCLFVELEKRRPQTFWAWRWFVSPEGVIVDPMEDGKGLTAINVLALQTGIPMHPDIEMMFAINVLPLLHCQWLLLSFLHTKNTNLVEVTPPPALAKKSLRRRGYPLHPYKVLEIEPLQKLLNEEGDAKRVGLQRALHICRGHFRDYRKHGLFGKHKDIFWFESHVRGNPQKRRRT